MSRSRAFTHLTVAYTLYIYTEYTQLVCCTHSRTAIYPESCLSAGRFSLSFIADGLPSNVPGAQKQQPPPQQHYHRRTHRANPTRPSASSRSSSQQKQHVVVVVIVAFVCSSSSFVCTRIYVIRFSARVRFVVAGH